MSHLIGKDWNEIPTKKGESWTIFWLTHQSYFAIEVFTGVKDVSVSSSGTLEFTHDGGVETVQPGWHRLQRHIPQDEESPK